MTVKNEPLPKGWREVKIIDFSPLQRGFDLPAAQIKEGTYPVVYSNGIKNYHSEYKAKAPGVVTGRSGTIGEVTYVTQDYWPHNTSLWVTDFKGNHPKFVFYFLQNLRLDRFYAGSGVPTLNRNDVHKKSILIPTLPEQKAIASLLEKWDTAIEKTEALIGAKEKRFKWLLKTLISDQQDNPEWQQVKLGEILEESQEMDTTNDPTKRLTVRLHLKGVAVRDHRGTEAKNATYYFKRRAGQLIYGKQNIFRGAIGIIPTHLDGYSSSRDIPAFDVSSRVSVDWLYLFLSRSSFYKSLERLSAGSGSKRLHPIELYKIVIRLPPIWHQEQVARIFDIAQQEIDLLTQLAKQYRTQKRGLMQKLLTGKRRVNSIKGEN